MAIAGSIRSEPLPAGEVKGKRIERSLAGKLALLIVIFLAVPFALYRTFLEADTDRRALLVESVQERGRLVAAGLEPLLRQTEPSPLLTLGEQLGRFASRETRIKVLFRPADQQGAASFFFVASEPSVGTAQLANERNELMRQGILDSVAVTCRGNRPLANRYRDAEGKEEVLTSVTPVRTEAGCWAIVLSHPLDSLLGTSLGEPYWMRFEVRVAAAIYLAMAVLTLLVFLSIRRSVLRFRQLARDLRTGRAAGRSFASQNEVAELSGVAEEFDRLIMTLRASAERIRQQAEDDAHALKTPIAIMRQSLEPLKRIVPPEEGRGRRALDVIETSIDRLDQIVSAARRMDEAMAELLDPPRQKVDLSRLLKRMVVAYGNVVDSRGVRLVSQLDERVIIRASEELLETVVENILDNSVSVSAPGTQITVVLRRALQWAELSIADEGPGVPPEDLERIFERRFTTRALQASVNGGSQSTVHTGIGLWIVRRNVEAIGGRVHAENRPEGGLIMRVKVPLAGE